MNNDDQFQARIQTPFATLGVLTDHEALLGIRFLPCSVSQKTPRANDRIAQLVCAQLMQYLLHGDFSFDLPIKLIGTPHELAVWAAMREISAGATDTYGNLAVRVGSSPRAVGTACGRNPVPVIIACHRVVAANGLGGFMGGKRSESMSIKQWLLRHESTSDRAEFALQ